MRRWFSIGCALVVSLAATSRAGAAFWNEVGDAGNLPGSAQAIVGVAPLDGIRGTISTAFDPDMYRIFITGGGTFSATTVGQPGSLFDTALYLFDAQGRGVYANDDEVGGASFRSTLPAGDARTPLAAGIYYLLIAQNSYFPSDVNLNTIFPIFPQRSVAGPTDPGGPNPIASYVGFTASEVGTYTIAITGAMFIVPEPSSLTLTVIAAATSLAVARTRRRRGDG